MDLIYRVMLPNGCYRVQWRCNWWEANNKELGIYRNFSVVHTTRLEF